MHMNQQCPIKTKRRAYCVKKCQVPSVFFEKMRNRWFSLAVHSAVCCIDTLDDDQLRLLMLTDGRCGRIAYDASVVAAVAGLKRIDAQQVSERIDLDRSYRPRFDRLAVDSPAKR